MDPESALESKATAELMIKEYELLHALVASESAYGEQRVNFFLTVASAAIGVMVVLSQVTTISGDIQYAASQGGLIVLLLFGLTTLNRHNARVVHTMAYSVLMEKIRGYFAERDPEVAEYFSARRKAFERPKSRLGIVSAIIGRFGGSLQELMILSNALLCGGIALVAMSHAGYSLGAVVGWTTATVAGAIMLLVGYHFIMRRVLYP